jgi:hypothetical protein
MFFTNPDSTTLVHKILCFIFLEGCKVSFSAMINTKQLLILAILISIENFNLLVKQNIGNFVKKIVDSVIVKTCDELDRVVKLLRMTSGRWLVISLQSRLMSFVILTLLSLNQGNLLQGIDNKIVGRSHTFFTYVLFSAIHFL